MQIVTASQSANSDYALYIQLIESVRTFAGQTVTLSFWARANSGTPKIAAEMVQDFGTGGSPSGSTNTPTGAVTISTTWQRYSMTVAIPSLSGKTIGTNNNDFLGLFFWLSGGSDFNTRASSIGNQNNTFQIWGVQVEAGSVATPFTTATGTLAGELAACQRYYWRQTATGNFGLVSAAGIATSTNTCSVVVPLPVRMRTSPTILDFANLRITDLYSINSAATSLSLGDTNGGFVSINVSSNTVIQNRPVWLTGANDPNGFLGLSAEL